MNNSSQKAKLKLNMTTKGPLSKQIIVFIKSNNVERIMAKAHAHVSNINKLLKGVKSEILVDFIHSDNKRLLITTNKVVATSDLITIKKYVKEFNNIDLNDIISSRLPQSKPYFKILGISYFVEDINLHISSDIIESIIKSNQIFNNIVLASHSYIIKASPKSDIVMISGTPKTDLMPKY